MPIAIGFNSQTETLYVKSSFSKELSMSLEEKAAFKIINEILSDCADFSSISLERRSDNYLTLCCGQNDFLRFKFSPQTKWISLRLSIDERKENINNPLFAAQLNKRQYHWKAKLQKIEDLWLYKDFIISSCHDVLKKPL